MRRSEVELIAALVEGRLEDETEARALIDSSQAHRTEYEAQKLAYDALSSLPPAELTEHERAALHRDIWAELQARPTAAPETTPWYMRWSYAAAGLFVIVGLFVVVDQTNPNFAPTALFGEVVSETFREVSSGADDATDQATDSGGESAETTSAATSRDAQEELPEEDGAALAESAPDSLANLAALARSNELTFESVMKSEDVDACLAQAGLVGYISLGEVVEGDSYIVAIPDDIELGPGTPVSFVNVETCVESYLDE